VAAGPELSDLGTAADATASNHTTTGGQQPNYEPECAGETCGKVDAELAKAEAHGSGPQRERSRNAGSGARTAGNDQGVARDSASRARRVATSANA